MLSKKEIKNIQLLKQKKYRNKFNFFVVEGKKSVLEFINNSVFEVVKIYHTNNFEKTIENAIILSDSELKKISFLTTHQQILGVFKKKVFSFEYCNGLHLALDSVQDPGNLGTIIRLCDWFGVTQLICSNNTVDCFNPKVVQATMGSLNRVKIIYTNLHSFLKESKNTIYAAVMDGKNVYQTKLNSNAILVLGNEANGISKENLKLVTDSIAIPRFGNIQQTESLNVATATAILLSEFRRV